MMLNREAKKFRPESFEERESEKNLEVKEFAFIMLKPLATSDAELSAQIINRLEQEGVIRHLRDKVVATKEKIVEHYKTARGKEHFRPVVEYLSGKQVMIFVLEQRIANKPETKPENFPEGSFIHHLREDVIGPSNPEQTMPHHIRNLTIKEQLSWKIKTGLLKQQTAIDNLIHCSDSLNAALNEINNWYKGEEEVTQKYQSRFEQIKQ